jgi:hypothetical protein
MTRIGDSPILVSFLASPAAGRRRIAERFGR